MKRPNKAPHNAADQGARQRARNHSRPSHSTGKRLKLRPALRLSTRTYGSLADGAEMRRGKLECQPFSTALLHKWLGDSHGVHYLADYLTELKATAILCENHYVDRHFVDDFATYYARSFNAPEPYCKRLHFFGGLSDTQLTASLDLIYSDPSQRQRIEGEIHFHAFLSGLESVVFLITWLTGLISLISLIVLLSERKVETSWGSSKKTSSSRPQPKA